MIIELVREKLNAEAQRRGSVRRAAAFKNLQQIVGGKNQIEMLFNATVCRVCSYIHTCP